MAKQQTEARKSAVDYAVEAAEPFDAARSTDDKPRPVSVTSTDEARAAEGLKRFELEEELPSGRRLVHRVDATDTTGALWVAFGDVEASVVRVEELPAR